MTTSLLEDYNLWIKATKAYNAGEPVMSDFDFDMLVEKLMETLPKDSEEYTTISKSVYRGESFDTDHNQDVHEMISLFKIKYQPNYIRYDVRKFFKEYHQQRIYVSPKLDGISIKIDPFTKTIHTRNAIVTAKLPHLLKEYARHSHIVCGELVIPTAIFNEKYKDEYATARTLVSSIINSKDITDDMRAIIGQFKFIPCTNGVNVFGKIWTELYDVNMLDQLWTHYQSTTPCSIDGIVLAVDEHDGIRKVKNNYPLNMVAIKFPQSSIQAEIIDIQWNLGKTGKYIPVAIIKEVKIGNHTFKNVQLYNYDFIRTNKIGIGSLISITPNGFESVQTHSENIPLPDDKKVSLVGKNLVSIDESTIKQQKYISSLQKLCDMWELKGFGDKKCLEVGELYNYDILSLFDISLIGNLHKVGAVGLNLYHKVWNNRELSLTTLILLLNFDGIGDKQAEKISTALINLSKGIRTKGLSESIKQTFLTPKTKNWNIINSGIKQLMEYNIKIIQK
jgi:NAD-dependent DNA ligase